MEHESTRKSAIQKRFYIGNIQKMFYYCRKRLQFDLSYSDYNYKIYRTCANQAAIIIIHHA
jgi:hypothetical protein